MHTVSCESIRESLTKHLIERTAVEHHRDLCIVTVPLRTVDGRLADVFVESRAGDYYFVHDGGKAANEIILHGMSLTASMRRNCEKLASNFGVQWTDEMFQAGCKAGQLNTTIVAVATCSALATVPLLEYVAEPEEDAVREHFAAALRSWGKRRARIREHVPISGRWKQHSFDFVAYPKGAAPIAISILSPSGNSIASADRAAFRAADLQGTTFQNWRKVIVETRAESWTGPAKDLLAKCSDAVIEIYSGELPSREEVAESLTPLLEAA